ncbi:uncharacterized protein LAESUDRAFT_181974 [Laetiporus sulphureus 93-53]|uniref:Uncharacterized protein n=1 Tax=Laetiporus sulphureus 93-53 TaxID=1314785 RepID=A0A165E9H1_9APHY|nr:uncharacterized protein LAESUDRAFT_181974 [Laetiporus sulphureus 93-53]KZT06528.1 hypothetical protein LAESUDRAFT_181974 [Laetiporus sulphureus 93-53]
MSSRPPTPDSPMANSLRRATSTIDDLTLALANFSRVASPDLPNTALCCCGKEDCETSIAWAQWKAQMESKLVLSAEVGQALLERHEAYVRRHEAADRSTTTRFGEPRSAEEHVDARVAELVKENAVLEKRLTQALVNSEAVESSQRNALEQLQEARSTNKRLTAQHARSVGWENRLAVALQDKDDLQQERDSAAQRAKLAEARINTLKDKCAKLQAQNARLREDLDMQRVHRHELSEDILSDARQRLAQLQQSQLGHAGTLDDAEVTKVLESLVADNEALKRDNAELRNLLAEAREDLRSLQEEVEERRAGDSSYLRHRHTNSGQSSALAPSPLSLSFQVGTAPAGSVLQSSYRRGGLSAMSDRRAISVERPLRRAFEPLTPETDGRPLSPTDSLNPSETKWSSFAQSHYASSHHSFEIDDRGRGNDGLLSPERTRAQKSLLLLTRSRGVQTDGTTDTGNLRASSRPPSFGDQLSSSTPNDGRSESSSLADLQAGSINALIERVTMLLNRITQADALTLTNRLKRQRLLGADVSHLSRTTVSSILKEASTMRTHFRALLEDEKAMMACTRTDLRALFKLFKDMFSEMGQMRITLNDVILDPSVAAKVSDLAMHPEKAAAAQAGNDALGSSTSSSWIAPITKLLGLPGGSASASANESPANRASMSPPLRPLAPRRMPSRIVPKREAALSASSMTVNVEFSGTAAGRSVTSTYHRHPQRQNSISAAMEDVLSQPAPSQQVSRNLMNIFAGAPRAEDGVDPWIVVPKPQRPPPATTATIGRAGMRKPGHTLSRTVDAMIDREEQDGVQATLLDRTLSRRGLSDSSIHTTFLNHGEPDEQVVPSGSPVVKGPSAVPDRASVLQTLSRKVQAFRGESGVPELRPDTPVGRRTLPADGRRTPTLHRSSPRAMAQGNARLFSGLAWAASALEEAGAPSSYMAGSPREEGFLHRPF